MILNPLKSLIFSLLIFSLFSPFSFAQDDYSEEDLLRLYEELDKKASSDKSALTLTEIRFLFRETAENPIASVDRLPHYDPTGKIGFCYGRAMAAQLIARQMGLANSGIRKLFIIGDLRSGENPEWRFHVTTLVKGKDGLWYAIDPLFSGPLPLHVWTHAVRSIWDKEWEGLLYITNDSVMIPDLRFIPPPEEETGEYIAELSFNPEDREGFIVMYIPGTEDDYGYIIRDDIAPDFFTNVYDEDEEGTFRFIDIIAGGTLYEYNNYFVDLLTDLMDRQEEDFDASLVYEEDLPWMPEVEEYEDIEPEDLLELNELFSPRFLETGGLGGEEEGSE